MVRRIFHTDGIAHTKGGRMGSIPPTCDETGVVRIKIEVDFHKGVTTNAP